MTPFPGVRGSGPTPIHFWRVDDQRYTKTWDSGEGARLVGGRWNPVGQAVV